MKPTPAIISGYDLVLDGTDDFATRFAVSDACLADGKTLVSGALGRWTGQVGVFEGPALLPLPGARDPAGRRDLRPGRGGRGAGRGDRLDDGPGSRQGDHRRGPSLAGRLLIYDALAAETRTVRIGADPACPSCGG
jgi:molybdopterin/thiamine biosynthesis adenylyltransferase